MKSSAFGDSTLRVSPAKNSLFLTQSVLLVIAAISLVDLLRGRNAWIPFAVASAGYVLLVLWLSRFSLVLDGEALRYRTLFRVWTVVRLEDIEAVNYQIGEKTFRDKQRPPIRLHVKTKPSSRVRPFDINLKVFTGKGLATFLVELERLLGSRPLVREGGPRAGRYG